MENVHLNHLAIIAATSLCLLLGSVWWSPILFEKLEGGNAVSAMNFLKKGNMAKIFGYLLCFYW